jgi:hypothetical protein
VTDHDNTSSALVMGALRPSIRISIRRFYSECAIKQRFAETKGHADPVR